MKIVIIVIVFLLIICFLQLFIQTKETDSELRAKIRRNDAIYNFRMYLILLGYVQKKDPKYYEKELPSWGKMLSSNKRLLPKYWLSEEKLKEIEDAKINTDLHSVS